MNFIKEFIHKIEKFKLTHTALTLEEMAAVDSSIEEKIIFMYAKGVLPWELDTTLNTHLRLRSTSKVSGFYVHPTSYKITPRSSRSK